MKARRDPDGVHPPLAAHSHRIEVAGGERLLVMSGQVGMRPDGALPGNPLERLQLALDNVRRNLEAAGMGIDDLVKLTLYLVGDINTQRRREVVAAALGGGRP